jgi:hypothetical protein
VRGAHGGRTTAFYDLVVEIGVAGTEGAGGLHVVCFCCAEFIFYL